MSGPGHRQPTRTAALVGALVAALLLVVALASVSSVDWTGRTPVTTGTATPPPPATPAEATPPLPSASASGQGDLPDVTLPPWLVAALRAVVVLLAALAALALLAVLLRWAGRRLRLRRIGPSDPTLGTPLPDLVEELLAGAPHRSALLSTGEPRNAIIECWESLTATATSAGLLPRASDTPTEYVVQVLSAWGDADLDGDALNRLADRYREARFSDHPVTEDARRQAISALTALEASIAAAAGRARPEPPTRADGS